MHSHPKKDIEILWSWWWLVDRDRNRPNLLLLLLQSDVEGLPGLQREFVISCILPLFLLTVTLISRSLFIIKATEQNRTEIPLAKHSKSPTPVTNVHLSCNIGWIWLSADWKKIVLDIRIKILYAFFRCNLSKIVKNNIYYFILSLSA